jgi:hypothetical protein
VNTRRDAEIVAFIGSLGAAGAVHVMERFGMSRYSAYHRLHLLTGEGLLSAHQILWGHPGLYTATRAGLRWRGLERLGVTRLGPGSFEHAWELASAAVALERSLLGHELVGERLLRIRERDEGLIASVVVGRRAGGQAILHRPDLALLGPDGRAIAVEVELSVKTPTRLAAICQGYARARHVARVFYLATPPAARALARAVRETCAAERVTILDLHDGEALARVQPVGAHRVRDL